ncbi:T-cell-specific surface glycoprotein CD28 [Thalassophryne amazonica]|uniref:T-cell-specific surface glycoprotein CD28 n=1 Tax=Thalassophryne amazonica TaxID=390379 RepID=UPI00147241B1|nr:T-cell-specific surface glycoprotein CD28 [Thalassophryne amazonica]
MQETTMSICWIFMIFLSCRSSHVAESAGNCSCKDQLENICVSASSTVQVPCPKVIAEDVKFSLIKDQQVISNYSWNNEKNTQKCATCTLNSTVGVTLDKNPDDASVSFILTNVTVNSNGNYTCVATVEFPPPMLNYIHAPRILVHAEEQCKCNPDHGAQNAFGGNQVPLWIWIVGFAVLGVYSLIITAISISSCLKLRKTESQNDYMNTKPRAPNNQKKNKRVQNPIPRHF